MEILAPPQSLLSLKEMPRVSTATTFQSEMNMNAMKMLIGAALGALVLGIIIPVICH